jgi:HAMP domain-containing protein
MTRLADKLADLAKRVVVNVPDRRMPEQFHAEKSEIAHELRRIAKEVERAKA